MAWQYAAMAGFQIYQGFEQANLMRKQADLNRQITNMNLELAEIDAFNAQKDNYAKINEYVKNVSLVLSDQRAKMAAANIDASFGTAADIVEESKLNRDLNLMDMQNQATMAAAGYKNQIANMKMQGFVNYQAQMTQAQSTQMAGIMGAANTGLSYLGTLKSTPSSSSEIAKQNGTANLPQLQSTTGYLSAPQVPTGYLGSSYNFGGL